MLELGSRYDERRILTLMFLLPLFTNLPHATLAAIVIHAMLGLLDFGYLKNLWRQSRWELSIAMVAYLAVMAIGVLAGIGLGVALSLLLLIYRSTSPANAVLGREPGKNAFRDVSRHQNLETYSGLLIFRFDSSLIFASANHFSEALQARMAAAEEPVRQVLIDAETISLLDTIAAEMLRELQTSLDKRGVALSFARLLDPVRDKMALAGLVDAVGADSFFETLSDGVAAFQSSDRSSA